MPIYEYVCSKCKGKFELLRPMSQSQESGVCPVCGSQGRRVASVFARSSDGSSPLPTVGGGSGCSSCSSGSCSSCAS